jgi:hypothetical protein
MDLLIVPLVLALVTVAFTWQQERRQTRIEDRRAETERQIEEQRAQDAALQAYLDQMSTLLLDKDLRSSGKDSKVRSREALIETISRAISAGSAQDEHCGYRATVQQF